VTIRLFRSSWENLIHSMESFSIGVERTKEKRAVAEDQESCNWKVHKSRGGNGKTTRTGDIQEGISLGKRGIRVVHVKKKPFRH